MKRKNEVRKPVKKNNREKSLQEIGDLLGLTRMRICQLEKSILEKLRLKSELDVFVEEFIPEKNGAGD